jgi:uncharacterized membrane protein
MKNGKLTKFWDTLQSSYWFLPGLMALAGIILALMMLALDEAEVVKTGELSWIYQGGPDGARGLLSAVAGSMVTVAATAFSITIVALQLAASNFGPRLLRNFMQDIGNQIVLGTFIATFLYCLLVLRTIHGEDYNLFVPQLSVTFSIILAIASIGVLIYFIHHASTIIQASHVIESVAKELDEAINRLFPEDIGQNASEADSRRPDFPEDFYAQAHPIQSIHTGYLQIIDDQQLLKLAAQYNLLLHLASRPGEFIVKGQPLLLAYPGERINPKLINRINQAFLFGKERTEQQDIEFPINQLAEIALRALSPAINDPFTAIRCVDRLSAGLTQLVQRPVPSAYRYDDALNLRVIAEPVSFDTLFDSAFSQIRRYGASDVAVTVRLLQAIELIINQTTNSKHLSILRQHAENIFKSSCNQFSEEYDRQMIEKEYQVILEMLEKKKLYYNDSHLA